MRTDNRTWKFSFVKSMCRDKHLYGYYLIVSILIVAAVSAIAIATGHHGRALRAFAGTRVTYFSDYETREVRTVFSSYEATARNRGQVVTILVNPPPERDLNADPRDIGHERRMFGWPFVWVGYTITIDSTGMPKSDAWAWETMHLSVWSIGFNVLSIWVSLCALHLGVRHVRINRRRKLGLCVQCAYSIEKDMVVCPECGRSVL